MKKYLLALAAALLVLVLAGSPAVACSTGGGDAWLIFHGDGTAWFIVHGVLLNDVEQMSACVAAINIVPGTVRILDAMVLDPETGEDLGLLQFEPDRDFGKQLSETAPMLGRGIDELPKVRHWAAFKAIPTIPFEEQIVDFAFELQIDPALDAQGFAMTYNAVGLFAMGGLTEDGQPHPDHFAIRRPMEIHTMEP